MLVIIVGEGTGLPSIGQHYYEIVLAVLLQDMEFGSAKEGSRFQDLYILRQTITTIIFRMTQESRIQESLCSRFIWMLA